MKCNELLKVLEQIAPKTCVADWDNSGFLLGDREREIKKVMLALDPTFEVIKQAIECKADMLITHHPLLFRKIKAVTADDVIGRKLLSLIENKINYVAMHTNADATLIAKHAAASMGLTGVEILTGEKADYECVMLTEEIAEQGYGVVGNLQKSVSTETVANMVKEYFAVNTLSIYGDKEKMVQRIAILPGSGGDEIEQAMVKGADIYITGDIKYHEGMDAAEAGFIVIDAGHYGLEKSFPRLLEKELSKNIPELSVVCACECMPYEIM